MFISSLGAPSAEPPSQVYFCNKKITNKTPCHDRVGKAYLLAIKELRKGGDCFKPLEDMGVERNEGREELLRSVIEKSSTLALSPLESEFENSGVYCGDKDFVFKVGARRLGYEMLVETAARETGLDGSALHVIPFVYRLAESDDKENTFSFNIPEDKENITPLIETLWNGKEKESVDSHLSFGGIQFFMGDKSVTVEQYSEKVMLALVIGLRDGKELEWKRLSDVEDSFASQIDPPFFDSVENFEKQAVAATDLPFLQHAYSTSLLSQKQIVKLAKIVTKWDVDGIAAKLGQKPILFYDRRAEKFDESAAEAVDECGTSFVWKEGEPHQIDGEGYAVNVNQQQTILNKKQVAACKERMTRIQKFVLNRPKGSSFTTLDMVKAVDPFFQIYWDAIMRIPNRDEVLGQTDPYKIIGRQPLKAMTNSLRCPHLLPALSKEMFDRMKQAFTKDGFVGLPLLPGQTEQRKSHLEEKSPPKTEKTAWPPKKPFKTTTRARWFPNV